MSRQVSSDFVRSRLFMLLKGMPLLHHRAWVVLSPSRIVLDRYDKVGSVFIEPLTQRLRFDTTIYSEQTLEGLPAHL